jgi:soluble lytic murein transglycosylase-like protein
MVQLFARGLAIANKCNVGDIKTSRPYQERFLDGFDRSELRAEVEKVKPKRFKGFRRKYTTWALGASLAFGGLAIPMKMLQDSAHSNAKSAAAETAPPEAQAPTETAIQGDLQQAKSIADQVAGGVQAVAGGVQQAATEVAKAPIQAVVEAPKQISVLTEQIKEQFFKTRVPFGSIIYTEARKNNLPPELVAAVAHTESSFVPTARSTAGAVGLMQLVPRTGRWLGARDLANPADNIMAGTKYLKYLTDRFGGDQQKVLAAYNAGEGNVRRFNGVPPFRETRDYVQRVLSFQQDLGDQLQGHVASLAASP